VGNHDALILAEPADDVKKDIKISLYRYAMGRPIAMNTSQGRRQMRQSEAAFESPLPNAALRHI
jgi:hypothetical protein